MKNKKIIITIVAVLLVVGIIVGATLLIKNKNKSDGETKLKNTYDKLTSSQTYLFEMKQDDENKTVMAKRNDETVIDQYSKEGGHSTTLVKDGNTYLILHDRKEYYVYERNNIEQSILTDGIHDLLTKKFTEGTEKIDGKNYRYEEYNTSTIFMITNSLKLDENVKTRFYFDKNKNLTYIKTIYENSEETLKINISNSVDDSLFTIPSTYAEN